MFSHPHNFQHPTRWHVRNYGLLCANPFGNRQFPEAEIRQTSYTIPEGDTLKLRYRVFLHRGNTTEGKVADAFESFAKSLASASKMPLVFKDDFEDGMENWVPSDARLPKRVWAVSDTNDSAIGKVLRVSGKSTYQPPHRSPHSVALIKDVVVEDFELTAKVQNTNIKAGDHRDSVFSGATRIRLTFIMFIWARGLTHTLARSLL